MQRSHAHPDAYEPFEDSYGPVGHAPHFEVERVPGAAGEPARFRKTLKPGVDSDLLPMIHRENLLLMDMASRRLQHVAQSLAFTRDSSDTPFVVTTLDAGPSLNLWGRYEFQSPANPRTPVRGFPTPASFLLVLRHALLALREFHEAGFIHCDIHAGNICLPFERPNPQARAVRPVFQGLRLIDFGHTLSARMRFDEPLRLDPDAPESLRRVSPAFRAALRRDAAQGKAEAVLRLDHRLDLYALGAMAAQLLDAIDWTGHGRAVSLHPAMAASVDALLQQDCDERPSEPGLHERLLRPLEALLAQLAPLDDELAIPRRGPAPRAQMARETPLVLGTPALGAPGPAVRQAGPTAVVARPARGRRTAISLIAVGAVAMGGWAWYAARSPRTSEPVRSSSTPPNAPPTRRTPTLPDRPAPTRPSADYEAAGQDLNRMIKAAAGGAWREVDDAARSAGTRMQARPPTTPSSMLAAGRRAIERAEYADAASALREATRQTPDDWAAWSGYGYALLRLNDLPGARQALGRALRLRPQDASAWTHLAEVLALEGRSEAAASALRLSVYFSRQRGRTLAHLRATDDTRIAPVLQAIVREQGAALDRIPERTP